jgi:hypothetical protein
MGLKITELGVSVPGRIMRKFDGDDTTLTLSEEQTRKLHEATELALRLFDGQPWEAETR